MGTTSPTPGTRRYPWYPRGYLRVPEVGEVVPSRGGEGGLGCTKNLQYSFMHNFRTDYATEDPKYVLELS